MSVRQKLPTNSGAPVSLSFHREFMLFACVYVLIVYFECWCSLLVSRGLYMSLDGGFLIAHLVFLISIMPLRFNRRWPSDVRKLNVEHFRENPHSSWKIRLFLICTANLSLHVPFCLIFKYFLATDSSGHWPFGLSTFRTNDSSD
jgi:hypothetical protein